MVAPIILTFICPFSFLCICWFPPRDSMSKLGHICAAQLRSCHEGCDGRNIIEPSTVKASRVPLQGHSDAACKGSTCPGVDLLSPLANPSWCQTRKDGAISFPRVTKKGSIDLLAREPQYSSRVPVL